MPNPPDAALERFFDQAASEHVAAMASVGQVERLLCFADRRVRVRFAGSDLADALTAAFRPRVSELDSPADVTIGLWEERHAPGGALEVPWGDGDIGARGLVRYGDDARFVAMHEAGSLAVTLVDRERRALLYRVPDVGTLPWWERAAPLRPALFWALSGSGVHLVHAGAVGDSQRGGVLLAGAGGSGKTTVALAALAAGMSYVADDYLLLRNDGEPVAWNLFATAKLDAGHLGRFPQLAADVTVSAEPVAGEKAVLDVHRLLPHALVRSLPIRAVLVPRIRGGKARLRSTSAAAALLALAPSTAFQMPYDDGRVLGSLADVVRGVPAFSLDVGDDPGELADAVDRVLDAVERGDGAVAEPSSPALRAS